MTTNQRDGEQIDEDVDEEIQPIRNQESESLSSFASSSPSPTPNGVSTDETVDDAILWHNRLTHCAISTLQKAESCRNRFKSIPTGANHASKESKQSFLIVLMCIMLSERFG